MRKRFNSLEQLHSHVYTIFRQVVIEDLEPYIKELMKGAVYSEVYSTYDPPFYRRRYTKGGLGDTSLMVSSTIVDSLKSGELQRFIEHLAVGADSAMGFPPGEFAKAIQTRSKFAGNPETGMPPRPYMYVVKDRIENNPEEFLRILKKGFRERGINVR